MQTADFALLTAEFDVAPYVTILKRDRVEEVPEHVDAPVSKKSKLTTNYLLCGTWEDESSILSGYIYTPTSEAGEKFVENLLRDASGEKLGVTITLLNASEPKPPAILDAFLKVFPSISEEEVGNLGTLSDWSMGSRTPVIPIYANYDD